MIVTKEDINVVINTMEIKGAKSVSYKILVGVDDGSDNIIMRLFSVEKDGYTPMHEHSYEHIIHIQRGQGVIIGQGGEEKIIKEGMSVFIPGNVPHQIKNLSPQSLEFLCIIPNPDRLPHAPACMG